MYEPPLSSTNRTTKSSHHIVGDAEIDFLRRYSLDHIEMCHTKLGAYRKKIRFTTENDVEDNNIDEIYACVLTIN